MDFNNFNMKSLIKLLFLFDSMFSVVKGYVHLDWEVKNRAFDPNLYAEALDPELCDKQLEYIVYNNSWLQMECKYLDNSNIILLIY